jgi:hypothetical protein
MSNPKKYINELPLKDKIFGDERRENLQKEVLYKGTPLPLPVRHRDIDEDFKRWVEQELRISYEDVEIPTMVMLSGQRLSEFAQTYLFSDNNKNVLLNFKGITRDPNPLPGSLHTRLWNIPGERHYLMHREEVLDKNGTTSYLDYKMKQPYCLDFVYRVSIFTNKFDLINIFNELTNTKFKARQAYIRPNGHFMPLVLENISDQSEYNIKDRTYFSQTFEIRAMCYIINEEDFEVIEQPKRIPLIFEGETKRKPSVEIEEGVCKPKSNYYYKPLTITIDYDNCNDISKFVIDTDMAITGITTDNVRTYKLKINGEEPMMYGEKYENNIGSDICVFDGDQITVKIIKQLFLKKSQVSLNGYDPNVIYDTNKDFPENINDETQPYEEIMETGGDHVPPPPEPPVCDNDGEIQWN